MVVFGHGLEEWFFERWEDFKGWFTILARSLSSWCRENPAILPLLLIPFLLLYLAVLYKIIQIAAFMVTVGSLKEALRWSDLPFFRYEPVPAALAIALGLFHLLGSVRAVRRLRLEGPRPLLDEIGAKRLGRAYELSGPAGRRRQEFWLYANEWLAAAARIPPPDLYIMPEERAINLMAMGLAPDTSVICATYASFAQLTDPEAEAMLAYGVARIQNGSAAFETRWSGVLYGLMSISLIGRRMARREEGWLWVPWLFELAMRGLGLIGSIAARWFQALLCQGEAGEGDAAAIELLGDLAVMRFRAKSKSRPESAILREERRKGMEAGEKALAQALKTVHGWYLSGRIKTKMALSIAPLFFASPDLPAFSLRHPKLLGRIRDLDPDFAGNPVKVFPVPDSMMGGREM
jgi:Zn-dependent protease with chaperone function